MSNELRSRLFEELDSIQFVDPHTHINALDPTSSHLGDILGYHYYTELAHSAGLTTQQIEDAAESPRELVPILIEKFGCLDNTIQYSWFSEILSGLFGIEEALDSSNWEQIFNQTESQLGAPDWCDQVFEKSHLKAVFLTNDFDDPLAGFDTDRYIPCLRTDDLVFHLGKPETVSRLNQASGEEVTNRQTLDKAIEKLFEHFKANGARACAISLPPGFQPESIVPGRAEKAVDAILKKGIQADTADQAAVSKYVFWKLAQCCDEFKLPFDLMIGVNRGVYTDGVYQGQDLYDSRVSLIQYRHLFNYFADVKFPISVLASVTNQELVSYSWIFPNVLTNGHWWYSNTPTYIEHDAAARLEAVPRNKQIGYYSDMYKMEFALPKFNMYKRILAKILAEKFVIDRRWTETDAIALGKQVLSDNSESVFGF